MAGWRPIPALTSLRQEIDREWPKRDRTSDGIIGDAAHSARVSDHNPDENGDVHAIDIDKDGINVSKVLKRVIGDKRVWYVIHNRTIWSRTHGWQARRYNGSNPHLSHIHVSFRYDNALERDTGSWGIYVKATPSKPTPKPTPATPGTTYTVKAGDTLSAIAAKFDTNVPALVKLNKIEDPDVVQVGQVLTIKAAVTPKPTPKPEPVVVKSYAKLSSGVKPGKRHSQVRLLQRSLLKAGYGPIRGSVTNYYGENTEAAVRRFHRANPQFGKPTDGTIGPKGFAHLQKEADAK